MTLAALVGLLLSCSDPSPSSTQRSTEFWVGGIQVHERDHDHWVESLRTVGMNTVAVTVYAKQGDWDSDHFWYEDEEPSVVDEIRKAKALGLSVVLVLRVAVDHAFPRNRFIWHGMIMPRSHAMIRSWFDQYTAFAVKWARIAEIEGVDILGIGSELNSMTASLPIGQLGYLANYHGYLWYERRVRSRAQRFASEIEQRHLWVRGSDPHESLDAYLDERYRAKSAWAEQVYLRSEENRLEKINTRRHLIHDRWNRVVDAVRSVYGGKLTYAANFDAYDSVAFWDRLDLMGINAYFQLKPGIDEEYDDAAMLGLFTDRWEGILNRMARFQRGQGLAGMPIVFTELGYTFRRHSTVEPWAHDGFSVVGWRGRERRLVVWSEQPVDYDERRLALEGLSAARERSEANLAGILYWKLSTDRKHEAIEPFVLHVGPESSDGLQDVLAAFASPSASSVR